jgi:hypothetical protein
MARKAKRGERVQWVKDTAASSATDDCIDWPFKSLCHGYGAVTWTDGRQRKASFFICELAYGPKPHKMEAAHWCGNRLCCNPRHIRWATRRENAADAVRHGTTPRGSRNGFASLTEEQVTAIRATHRPHRRTYKQLAEEYGVHHITIAKIVRRQIWTHI